jgi:hypothetical protein
MAVFSVREEEMIRKIIETTRRQTEIKGKENEMKGKGKKGIFFSKFTSYVVSISYNHIG